MGAAALSAPLAPLYCANPTCPRALAGRPRVLGHARLMPGSSVQMLKCRSCHHVTRIVVTPDGTIQTTVRPAGRAA